MSAIEEADPPAVSVERPTSDDGWLRRLAAACAPVACCIGFALLGMLAG